MGAITLPEEQNSARRYAAYYCFLSSMAHHHPMRNDQSVGALKIFIKAVGLVLLISVLFVVIFAGEGTRPLGYLFFAGIGFLAWRMFRIWNKLTVQLYALIQSIMTGVALGQIGHLFWPQMEPPIAGFAGIVVILAGPPFERFLLRYTGFSKPNPKAVATLETDVDIAGTPWQSNPGYTTR
jgi:hypothetical protein